MKFCRKNPCGIFSVIALFDILDIPNAISRKVLVLERLETLSADRVQLADYLVKI